MPINLTPFIVTHIYNCHLLRKIASGQLPDQLADERSDRIFWRADTRRLNALDTISPIRRLSCDPHS